MHIHIARIPATLRRFLVGRSQNFAVWTKVHLPIMKQPQSSWPSAYVKYFSLSDSSYSDAAGAGVGAGAGAKGLGGPAAYRIFHQAFAMANFNLLYLQVWGIMIIPDEEPVNLRNNPHAGSPRGFYLVLSTNNRIGTWNPFEGTLGGVAENENYQPELLLCTAYSAGAGNFWRPEECYDSSGAASLSVVAKGSATRFTDALITQQLAQDAPEHTHH